MRAAMLGVDRAIASRLGLTWAAFFGRFGRLTDTQRHAIPAIIEGADVLLCAPTASGKTEAAVAPLIELSLKSTSRRNILYISPTRALANDMMERLRTPMEDLGLSLKIRTGDRRDSSPEDADILITTPESLDSMLCRLRCESSSGRPTRHPLSNSGAIVLDEIHSLYGGPRGEQLRWLVHRLRSIRSAGMGDGGGAASSASPYGLQVVALSATVQDPAAIARSFLEGGTVLDMGGQRSITSVSERVEPIEDALPSYLQRLPRPRKVLVFCNARKRVDQLTAGLRLELRSIGYAAYAHHGSLPRTSRLAAEAAMRDEPQVVMFATSTLELGIDIGDIDLVVMDGAAPDVPSFLQRVGRGNRHTGETRVLLCGGPSDETVHAALLDASREGWLGQGSSARHYGVARQQLASSILQSSSHTRPEAHMRGLLLRCCPEAETHGLLEHMVHTAELTSVESAEGGLGLGDDWLEKVPRGQIHSTIDAPPGLDVIDTESGELVAIGLRYVSGQTIATGGIAYAVHSVSRFSAEVVPLRGGKRAEGDYHYAVRSGRGYGAQADVVRRYLGLDELVWPVLPCGDGIAVFHLGGLPRMALLQAVARQASAAAGDSCAPEALLACNGFYAVLSHMPGYKMKPDWASTISARSALHVVEAQVDRLEERIGCPRDQSALPMALRILDLTARLRLDTEVPVLRDSVWTATLTDDLTSALASLMSEPS